MSEPKRLRYCINGEWLESKASKYMPVTNSSTGEVIAMAPCCTADEVNDAIQAAADAFPAWSNRPVAVRAQVMYRFKALVEQHLDELAVLTSTEVGKNLDEARGEYVKIAEACEMAMSLPMLMQGNSMMNVTPDHDTSSYREPLGVFAGIVPFNFPAMITFGWLVPLCITAGNTLVVKLASWVPLSGMRLLELLYEAGLPRGVVNIVTCSRGEADILLRHPLIKGVSFIGSTSTGLHVYSTAAAHGKRVQAQTEAKNHGIVLRDASLERAARGIVNSTYGCAGMRCMALPVLCVENACADEFLHYFTKFAKERVIGCAYDPKTELGPVVSAEHQKFVKDWITRGAEEGAELLLDGRDTVVPGCEGGHFVGATAFDHVTEEMSCGREEVFGPVTFIKRIDDFEEGLAIANGSRFANGSCIFTNSGYYGREFIRRTHGGMCGVNVGIPVPVSFFSFTGHKDSFFGDLHILGRDGLAFYTETKTATVRWFSEEELGRTSRISTWEGTTNRT
ncbi:MAG: CoA-acylating methylmalonate-semialdehyde dehydrogenase [Dehalococcoidales bacterium]|nr:CoA-acylating methylmalonate-semialdehyde dehydrogenase [Dehalococcoidales bacterium]